MSNKQRHRLAGSAVLGVTAAALLATTAAPAMAAETSIELPTTKVFVQVANKGVAVTSKTLTEKTTASFASIEHDENESVEPAPIEPPIDPDPIDPTPIEPPVDPGPIDPEPTDPPVEPTDPPVDPDPTDPPVDHTDPTDPPVGPVLPPVGPTTPPVITPPTTGGGGIVTKPDVPVAPNKPAPDGVKQPDSVKKKTTPLQPTGVTKSGAIKAPVKHAQRVAVKQPSGAIQRAVIPAGATSVKPHIPANAVLINTGLGAQSVAEKDAEFWSIIAGTTLITGAGAGMVVARRGRRAKA